MLTPDASDPITNREPYRREAQPPNWNENAIMTESVAGFKGGK